MDQEIHKRWWRPDIGMWESFSHPWWHYQIWSRGSLITMRTKNRRKRGSAVTVHSPSDIGQWHMSRDEFTNGECKGNRWLIPTNRVLRDEDAR